MIACRLELFEGLHIKNCMANVQPEQADTYKCFAANEFGRAVVTVVLNVIEGKRPDENVCYGKEG
ncbi:unnamed protein product [Coregonus sp. 'balchen']|nr:unnamed protein product [Coregonus sp. 'balchen']